MLHATPEHLPMEYLASGLSSESVVRIVFGPKIKLEEDVQAGHEEGRRF